MAFFDLFGGFAAVRVEPPGTHQLEGTSTVDLRVEKTFSAGRQTSIGVYVDAFNLTNQGIATYVTTGSGPNLGWPTSWSPPRAARAGVRVVF
jgi:hypothetical protein